MTGGKPVGDCVLLVIPAGWPGLKQAFKTCSALTFVLAYYVHLLIVRHFKRYSKYISIKEAPFVLSTYVYFKFPAHPLLLCFRTLQSACEMLDNFDLHIHLCLGFTKYFTLHS